MSDPANPKSSLQWVRRGELLYGNPPVRCGINYLVREWVPGNWIWCEIGEELNPTDSRDEAIRQAEEHWVTHPYRPTGI